MGSSCDPLVTIGPHYCDVIMRAMASQITDVSIMCSTVCWGAGQRKHQSSASLAFVGGIPSQRASNVEKESIWWRYHSTFSMAKRNKDDVMKWKRLMHYWPYVKGILRPVDLFSQRTKDPFTEIDDTCFNHKTFSVFGRQEWITVTS